MNSAAMFLAQLYGFGIIPEVHRERAQSEICAAFEEDEQGRDIVMLYIHQDANFDNKFYDTEREHHGDHCTTI